MLAFDNILAVDIGVTEYITCPSCGGRKSCGVTNTGEYFLYHCFKLGCGFKGKKYIHMTAATRKLLANVEKPSEMFEMPEAWVSYVSSPECYAYMQKVNIMHAYTDGTFYPMYDVAKERFVYPIYGKYGELLGGVGRAMGNQKPKTWNYHTACSVPFLCGKGDTLVIVEDCASAVSITRLPNTVGMALLGTSLKDSYIKAIKELKPTKIFVALDADARKKTLTICRRLANIFKNVRPLFLEQDIKDMQTLEGVQIC